MGFLKNLFGSKDKEPEVEVEEGVLITPAAGTVLKTAEISDPVFAQEMMGPTFPIKPSNGTVCAPVTGTISALYPTGHAFGITTPEGADVLVHIGIDTVGLNGKGFKILGKENQKVKAGEPVVEINLDVIKEAGLDDAIMTILTNPDAFDMEITAQPSAALSSKAPVGRLKKK